MTDGERWAEVAGGRLPYDVAGSGTGIVLAHAGIADRRQWDPQWDALAARHRVVRYDLRGFGGADVVHTAFSNRADLVAVMDAAGLDRAVLVGCSRAGSIVLDTTLEFPDRVSAVVWVCGGISGHEGTNTPEEEAAFERSEALEEAKDWAAAADLDVELWIDGIGQPAGRAPAAEREAVRRMAYETYVQEKPYGDTILLDPPAIGRLGDIRVPVLVICGLLDESSTVAAAGVVAESVPGARRIDLPDVTHLPNLERPDWFTATLLAFVAEVDAGS
jgi:pimeloyl-ACP methyl ester carboxylesterase